MSAQTKSQGFSSSQAKVWWNILCFMTSATFTSAGIPSCPKKYSFFLGKAAAPSQPPAPAELAVQVSLQCCSSCVQNHTESCIRKCLYMTKKPFCSFFKIQSLLKAFNYFLNNLFKYNKKDLILDDSWEDLGIYPELVQLSLLNVFSARCINLLVLDLPVPLRIYFFVQLCSWKLFRWE